MGCLQFRDPPTPDTNASQLFLFLCATEKVGQIFPTLQAPLAYMESMIGFFLAMKSIKMGLHFLIIVTHKESQRIDACSLE